MMRTVEDGTSMLSAVVQSFFGSGSGQPLWVDSLSDPDLLGCWEPTLNRKRQSGVTVAF